MKRFLIPLAILVALCAVGLAVLPFLVPASAYKSQVENAASRALGREVSVGGDVQVSLLPVISASVENITVANPDGFDSPHLLQAGALRGNVRILPLLSRRVEISKVSFENASVRLTRREDGASNWQLGQQADNPNNDGRESPSPFAASIDRASLQNATVIYEDRVLDRRYEVTELDFEATLNGAESPMALRASGLFQNEPFDFNATLTSPRSYLENGAASLDVKLGTNLGNVGFEGSVEGTDPIEVAGRFQANIPALGALVDFVELELPVDLSPVGGLRANGDVTGPLMRPDISFDELLISGDGINATYDGDISFAAIPTVDGNMSVSLRDVFLLTEQMGIPLPQSRPFKQVSATARVSGPIDGLSFSGIDARTSAPVLVTSYVGDLSFAEEGKLDGNLSAESPQLRQLLEQLGVGFPEGENMQVARISGRVTGPLKSPAIQGGTYRLDDMEATGHVAADLRPETPLIKADLDLPVLDLSPFIGNEKGATKAVRNQSAWSDAPIKVEALGLLNADVELDAERVEIAKVALDGARLQAQLNGGILNANLERFTAFGGDWRGRVLADASGAKPELQVTMQSEGVQMVELLGQLTGFERLSGAGSVDLDLETTGATVREMVRGLNGAASANVEDGALKGLNLGQMVRSASSLQDIVAGGKLTMNDFEKAVSPQAETDFSTFKTTLGIKNGLANIDLLELKNPALEVTGTGNIDLGAQTLDVQLTPAVDRTGQGNASTIQLNGVPIPLRIRGSWASPEYAPDLSGLQEAFTRGAVDRLKEELGGDLTDILTGPRGRSPDEQNEAPEDAEKDEDEDAAARAARDVLGAILNPD